MVESQRSSWFHKGSETLATKSQGTERQENFSQNSEHLTEGGMQTGMNPVLTQTQQSTNSAEGTN